MKHSLLFTLLTSLILSTGLVVADDTKAKSLDWDFKGQALFYYQTTNGYGRGTLFDQGPADANSGWAKASGGLQLSATRKNIGHGFGVGFEMTGLSSLSLDKDFTSGMVQNAGDSTGGAVTKAYITYGTGKTTFKAGRQHLPKSLSPFAFTEGWNAFKNSFDALLVVNKDIKDTTLVYAYVVQKNNSVGDLNDFQDFYDANGGVSLITAQNKSIKGLTLTGSYYFVPDAIYNTSDAEAFWIDAGFKVDKLTIALQGGYVGGLDVADTDDTTAFGAKVSGKFEKINYSLAYSTADDGTLNIANHAGSGVKSPFYTQGILNQNVIKRDSDSFKATVSTKAFGGNVIGAFMTSDLGPTALPSVFGLGVGGSGTYNEYELIYKKSYGKNIQTFTTFIIQNDDRQGSDDYQNFVRFWVKYNF